GDTPYIIVYNKSDLIGGAKEEGKNSIYVSAKTGENIYELKEKIAKIGANRAEKRVVADLVNKGDTVVLVIPVDESAPKGRIILPQQLVLRDLLDSGCSAICCQPEELCGVLENLKSPPKLVITDSQAFGRVHKTVPESVNLTSFSILLARYKGVLPVLTEGAARLKTLKNSDTVLISEGCTHHRQCNDIGTVKLPGWIEKYAGVRPKFAFTSGGEFPTDLSSYTLILHCGGCMLNEKEMGSRIERAVNSGTPIVNYGIAIAAMHGILNRALSPFPDLQKII
ncbi:MAG: [FeFe] hydrogenase H-cluster maturation GTPase HydF, partial [Clostridia bacterium]|nr:[FeFe] hydrogenase H-cluster maturation GTPase HydF [Clostridia bacterium]